MKNPSTALHILVVVTFCLFLSAFSQAVFATESLIAKSKAEISTEIDGLKISDSNFLVALAKNNQDPTNEILAFESLGDQGASTNNQSSYGCSTGCSVGCSNGCSVGCSTGCSVGCSVGCSTGCSVGCRRW